MSSAVKKYRSLVEKLYEQTISKRIKWHYESGDRLVWTRVAGQTVCIEMSSNNDFEPLCSLRIENAEGDYLEGFNDESLGPEKPRVGNFANWYLIMEATFESAKRQATGADEALDNILKELNQNEDYDDVEF